MDRLAETLNGMLARLDQAFSQSRRFAADAAHELRTPLAALRGGIEVALRARAPAEEYRRVLASSLEEVERLIRLAEDLLLLSRSMAGPEPGRAAGGPGAPAARGASTWARGSGQAAGVTVRTDARDARAGAGRRRPRCAAPS